jgi:hypothetical protein
VTRQRRGGGGWLSGSRKPKGRKRLRGWHKDGQELIDELPTTSEAASVDPASGAPVALHEHERRRTKGHGEALS